MSWDFEQDLTEQRIARLLHDADHARQVAVARRARRARRTRRLRRLLGPVAPSQLVASARAATDTLGLIFSAAWPAGPSGPDRRTRPALGR
jgi:hypothetical protein